MLDSSSGEPNRPWLVRRVERGKEWLKGESSAESLASRIFTEADDDAVSTYLVASDVEEARVAAAILCTRDTSLTDPLFLLRIPMPMVSCRKLEVLTCAGDTGIVAVDTAHRDIRGHSQEYVMLLDQLQKRYYSGEDMLRVVQGRALHLRLQEFCVEGASTLLTSPSIRRAQSYLKRLDLHTHESASGAGQ